MQHFFGTLFFTLLSFSAAFSSLPRTEPWLTEKAIAYLEKYLTQNPDAVILEFGSGASTLWFAERTPNLYSIEHNEEYYHIVNGTLKEQKYHDVHYTLHPLPYYCLCETLPDEFFDLILVDGRNRKGCIAHSLSKLKPGGILMLDNAERKQYHAVFPLMQSWKYISTEQTGPDKFGFWYSGWKTDWWQKPFN